MNLLSVLVTFVVQVDFFLSTVVILLMPDLLPHFGFIQSDPADTVSRRPKMDPFRIPSPYDEIPVDSDRQLSLQPPYRVCRAELWRNTQTQMDMVRHRMPFYQLHPELPAEIFQ